MVNGHLSLRKNYWETLEITPKDIGFLNNHLFELETPLSTQSLPGHWLANASAWKNMR